MTGAAASELWWRRHTVRYARTMRYPDGGGLTAAERARRERVRLAGSALEAATDAAGILVVTAWPEFAEINAETAGASVASKVIVDACQGIDTASWREAGWKVASLTATHLDPVPHDRAAPAAFRTAG
jgi:predicted dinucleotide-binding enzyme